MEIIPPEAMFLGPKSENDDFVLKLINNVIQDHVFWRRNFHPSDSPTISVQRTMERDYKEIQSRITQELFRLTSALKQDVPFFSPRYLAHMTSDILIPSLLGYIATILYNPNNVSWEGAPVTSRLEVEVGQQLSAMMGYSSEKAWGHIASGGTIANLEATWVAHNIKYYPLAIRSAARELDVPDMPIGKWTAKTIDLWQALNLTPEEIFVLDEQLTQRVAKRQEISREEASILAQKTVFQNSFQNLGIHRFYQSFVAEGGLPEVALLIPQTKHYCWLKAAEVIGLGKSQLIQIPVDEHYRQDMKAYRGVLTDLARKKITPIMSVTVCGSTEMGAVDNLAQIVTTRQEMHEKEGLHYILHCDAAWGGYARSVFLDANNRFKQLEEIRRSCGNWPSQEVYDSVAAMGEMDSITIDPHKLGYIPYPAGAIVYKDIRSRNFICQEASYALGDSASEERGEYYLGRYVMEGSKPGAAAAAVWLTHRVYPLNEKGYGELIARSIRGKIYYQEKLKALGEKLKDRFEFILLNPDADLNLVCYLFNHKGNQDLDKMNELNNCVYKRLHFTPDLNIHRQQFYLSKTALPFSSYRNSLLPILQRETSLKLDKDETVVVLRSTVMNPFIMSSVTEDGDDNYFDEFVKYLEKVLCVLCGCE